MAKKPKSDPAQAALGDEPPAPPKLEIDGAGWHVRTIALGYDVAELGDRAPALVAALKARYPRAAVRVLTTTACGDEVVSNLLSPLSLVAIAADDEAGRDRADIYDVVSTRFAATREVLAFVERWLQGATMATILRADGSAEELEIAGRADALQLLQHAVGGFIEAVPLGGGMTMMINEDGKIERLPLNVPATIRAGDVLLPGDFIAGDAVIGTDKEMGYEDGDE